MRIVALRQGKLTETHDPAALQDLLADGETRVWIDLTDPAPEVVESVGAQIGLHPLVAEDIIESNERAKVEPVDEVIHLVMFVLSRAEETETCEVDFVLGEHYLLSVHPAAWDPRTVHQLKLGLTTILGRGPDFLLWVLPDGIVDGYFPVFDQFAEEIDEVQDEIIRNATPRSSTGVRSSSASSIRIRHVIHPSREIFSRLTGREFELIGDAHVFYFRDVYDHLIRLTDEFDTFRELVAGALEVYLTTINNDLSRIMKRLTGVTVILAGIGAVGGLFGMSQATPALSGGEGFGFWTITHRDPRRRCDRGRVPAQDRLDLYPRQGTSSGAGYHDAISSQAPAPRPPNGDRPARTSWPFRPLPVHSLLLAAYPILFLFAQNMAEVTLGEVVPPLGRALIGAATVLLVARLVLRDLRRGAIVASALVVFWFGYGHLEKLLHPQGVSRDAQLVAWTAFLVLAVGAAVLLRERWIAGITKALDIIGGVLVGFTVVEILRFAISQPAGTVASVAVDGSARPTERDIYFLVWDRYGSRDSIEYAPQRDPDRDRDRAQ